MTDARDHAGHPIAIIGAALRLPGADSLDRLWDHLAAGRSLIVDVPPRRWDAATMRGDPAKGEFSNSIRGGFIEDADCFDAAFFNISPREAAWMDPQQRLALELAWRAIEDAACPARAVAGTRTGVYVGVCHWDYAELIEKHLAHLDAYTPTGIAFSIIANRISHFFDLRGPSIANDTACAASMTSVYEAVRALQSGECELALAGGINLAWSPNHFIAFSKNGMLSREGASRAFDERADGYVRGEGGAMLLLKPLARAVADGDPIHAVIRAVGTNHGGRTNSLTVTNPQAQAQLIVDVVREAGVAPDGIDYIEAHGTGTPLGDPIEIAGLKQAFATLHAQAGTQPVPGSCTVGSVKTNIGHLEGAAGVAGIVKVLAALRHETLPANADFQRANPLIDLAGSPLRLAAEAKPWPRTPGRPRRAGVSSFGFGGSNGHVLLEEPPAAVAVPAFEGPVLVPLSARDGQRLRAAAASLLDFVRQSPAPALGDLAWTLQVGREAMDARAAFIAADAAGLVAALQAFVEQRDDPRVWLPGAAGGQAGPLEQAACVWLAGGEVDWRSLYGGRTPRRMHAPGYQFARERHWFDPALGGKDTGGVPHPLLHRNVSRLDRQAYRSTFGGTEFFWADHHVGALQVLPGVACLEMARAGWALATGAQSVQSHSLRFESVVWAQPLRAGEGPVPVELRLRPGADGMLAFEVDSGGGGRVPAVQGRVGATAPAAAVEDIERLRAGAREVVEPAALYGRLRASGMHHGPTFQAVTRAWAGDGYVLAQLKLARRLRATLDALPLHPVLLDAAIQAWAAFDLDPSAPAGAAVPFACRRIEVSGACEETMWAVLRPGREGQGATGLRRFDISVCDRAGKVRVRFDELALRVMQPAHELVYSVPRWHEMPLPAGARAGTQARVFAAGWAPAQAEAIARACSAPVQALPADPADPALGAEQAFRALRQELAQALRSGASLPRRWLVVAPADLADALLAPLGSLMRTARAEQPRFSGAVLRIEGDASPARIARIVAAEGAASDAASEIRYDAQDRRLAKRQDIVAAPPAGAFRLADAGGIVWITGGLGGLARHLVPWLAARGVRRIVLSGRTSSAPVEALEALRGSGADVRYRACDVADAEQVRATVRWIEEALGPLKGVVHAAGLLRDGYLFHADEDAVSAVFAPKVAGLVNIDAATAGTRLEFMLVCSSIAGVLGNPAQSDYGAANAFMDAFATQRAAAVARGERHGSTLAIAWPLWAEGGMQVDAATRAVLERRLGSVPVPTEAALDALDRLLGAGGPERVLLQFGAAERIREVLDGAPDAATLPEATSRAEAATAPVARAAPAAAPARVDLLAGTVGWLKDLLAELTQQDAARIRSNRKLEEYGLDSITIVEMTSRMEEALGPLSKTLFFEYVDLDGLATHLVEEHADALSALLVPAGAATGPQPAADSGPHAPPALEPVGATVPSAAAPAGVPGHDIAIIGMSLRVSGADDADSFWRMLEQGLHGFERYPAARWDHDALLHPERDVPGKTVVRTGTFLKDIDRFDPRYFRISQAEAELMSPEVRLFLQSSVDAFEDAGYSRETLQRRFGGDVAVIVGSMTNEYDYFGLESMLVRGSPASGSYTGTLPNMVSYFYGFTGPSYFLDTMCSGAATCVHEAVQMLRTGRCQVALAGGVNLLLHPHKLISTSQEHFTTKTAEVIRGYGLGADGTILGEGVGAFVLKRLEDAQRDGDHIWGVIKGTAVTNAGVRNGFTVPTPQQQAAAIEKAWQDSGLDPRTLGYIEGHGSGTSLGDPIEVKALTQAFGKYTDARQFCPIGTVKSNVAHLLGAAALPGIAKVLLQMQHRMLAPSLHAGQLNPNIPFEQTPLVVQRELAPWRRRLDADGRELPLRAGVTSIGAGGMNAHLVLEEYRETLRATPVGQPELCVFSAMTPAALREVLARLCQWLDTHPGVPLADVAWTLQEGRNELPCRLALVADSAAALQSDLRRFLAAGGAATTGAGVSYSASILEHDVRVDAAAVGAALAHRELATIGRWWTQGVAIDWGALAHPGDRRRVALPAYPFEKVRCWYPSQPDAPSVVHPLGARGRLHPFIGSNASDLQGVRFHTVVRRGELLDYTYTHERRPFLLPLVVPETMAALANIAAPGERWRIEALEVVRPADWAEGDEFVASVRSDADARLQLALSFAGDAEPFARAWARRAPPGVEVPRFDLARLQSQASAALARADVYRQLAERKLSFGPYLEVIARGWRLADGDVLCALEREPSQQDPFKRHLVLAAPLLGAAWQALLLARPELAGMVLAGLQGLHGDSQGATHVLVRSQDVFFLDDDGAVLACLQELAWGLPGQLATPSARPQAVAAQRVAPAVSATADVGLAQRLTQGLRGVVAELLKFDVEQVNPRALFHDLGFDSISLTRLAAEIEARYGGGITPALFFQCEHVEAVAAWLAPRIDGARLGDAAPARTVAPASAPEPAAAKLPAASPVTGAPADRAGTLDVAIVGLAARLPQSADADEFFGHLLAGRDLVGPLPLDRYAPGYRARMQAAGFPLQGGFLQDVDRFDAEFFRTSPHEAARMDPQQRLLLETAWHAVEHAGYRPQELPPDTGVFVGASSLDYARVLQAHGVETDGYVATGNSLAMIANRLSWQLDLAGPSEVVDTACSSSLVALLRAAEALREGRCRMALVGGVQLALAAEGFEGPWKAGMLSPEGRCKTFARSADGYVRGEGVITLLLKPRADALRDGDRILGVLVGGAQNHGGRAGSLTAPNANAQAALVRTAMSGIPAASVGYIETHGTGTALGDPVEINGLRLAYDELLGSQPHPARIALGALKSSIGHLEAAAGLAGVAKVLLAMQAGELPPNLHADEPSPYIDLQGSPFFLLRERQPWPVARDAQGRPLPRRAAVSSFGFGGANAHVVLEAPDASTVPRRSPLPPRRFADTRFWIPGAPASDATVLLQPQWRQQALPAAGAPSTAPRRRVLVPCDFAELQLPAATPGLRVPPAAAGDIGERFEALAAFLLQVLQQEVTSAREEPVLLQLVVPAGDERSVHEGLGAMLDTAHAECPRLLGQVVSVPRTLSAPEALALLDAEARQPVEARVRYPARGDRQVLRWRELETPAPAGASWRAGGSYLVTGGMGGLGLLVAGAIAKEAPGVRLVLAGTGLLDERRRDALARLQRLGATVAYRQVDVADRAAVARLVRETQQLHGPLNGVVHCAGVHRDSALVRKGVDQLRSVFAPKVGGAVALVQACRGLALDHLVLFSSLAGATGNAGQADYAAANGFLDALAQHEGGRVVSINWPLWQDGGMRATPAGEQRLLDSMGQRALASEQGLAALRAVLAAASPQVAVVGGDAQRIRAYFGALGRRDIAAAAPPAAAAGDGLLLDRVGQSLRALLARLSGLDAQGILLDEALERYGIDSLMIVRLNDALKAQFGALPSSLFFEHRTLRGVARYLVQRDAQACRAWTGVAVAAGGAVPGDAPVQPHATRAPAPLLPPGVAREPIAIVGISGRYPGAPDLDTFWRNLVAGHDAISDIPGDRFGLEAFGASDPDEAVAQGRSYARRAGFLEGFAEFDPLFFRISPREALAMDPQERLFLMAAWSACEDAGYTRQRFAAQHGSRVGVFAGVTKTGYALHGPVRTPGGGTVRPGTSFASVANRVSHCLDLRGPSLPIDTMCSSSLTAIHEACEHLAAGDCEMAIAGGVNLYLHPSNFVELCASRMLSPDGVCRSFGAGGKGFVPGEGVGCVVLKPLSRALADGDSIHALVRGSAVNHGGKVNGYTVPNPVAQRDVVRAALQRAGLAPSAVSCLEAHGTGTELGDPIEFDGLVQAFADDAPARCSLGSVKSGIGHLEAAAGIAGLTKVVLQMRHRQLVPTLHAQPANPNLRFEGAPFVLQHALAPWQPAAADGRPLPRIAGVSSFGAGGANAHVVLEEWPTSSFPQGAATREPSQPGPWPILLSARTPEALRQCAQRLLDVLQAQASGAGDGAQAPAELPLEAGVRALLARVLSVDARDVDPDETFDGIGVQEMQRQALRHACEREYGIVLEPAAFRWLDSVAAIAAELRRRLPQQGAQAQEQPVAADLSLPDLAWTLQVGREAMDCRLAIAAQSTGALADSLRAWLAGERAADVFASTASEHRGTLGLLAGESGLGDMVRRWVAAGDLPRVLGLWVRGLEVDWPSLADGAARRQVLRLPTYPFARERFWIAPPDAAAAFDTTLAGGTTAAVALQPSHDRLERELASLVRALLPTLPVATDGTWPRWRAALEALLAADGPGEPLALPQAWDAWGRYRRELGAAHPSAQAALAETCLRALPDMLAGRARPTDVMFPSGQLAAVEAVYKRNAVATHFNERLAAVAAAFMAQRLAATPAARLRILEIGAGTGGTTERVLAALAPHAAAVAEYRYTDVSRAFLIHAERHLAPVSPFLRTALFDVEKPLAGQDVQPRGYDLVIAANVLHATRNIRSTLQTVHGLLAEGGVLLLNETSRATLFTHLTFGLLEGWWRVEDAERRVPCSPALAPESWRRALAEAGFAWLGGSADIEHALGQQVIVAGAKVPAPAPAEAQPLPGRGHVLPVTADAAAAPHDMPAAPPATNLREVLVNALAATLNVAPAAIDVNRAFADYGLDSILGAELVHGLRARLGVDLAHIQLFDATTVVQLEAWLRREHPQAVARATAVAAAGTGSAAPVAVPSPEPGAAAAAAPAGAAAAAAAPAPAAAAAAAREPIAIVGLSGRFAGSQDIEQLWQHLMAGRDLVEPVRRFDLKPYEGEVPPGTWCDRGSFIDGVEQFDAAFFNISGLEATYMDPQQRLFLEQAWLALEHGGHAGADIEGRRCGVFVGCAHGDYQELFRNQPPGQAFWGNTCSLIPARIAYYLDLKGPALSVDTACSSSLVAVHLACQSLWSGESELALAGGVFVQCSPRFYRYANQARMLSPSGRCAAFGADADGIVPGEAVVALLLRPLSQALADGDTVHGLIVATGTNQDGATNGITAPSAASQERLIREVYQGQGIDAARIGMVEAHGTGTVLGDPIEHAALSRAFRHWTDAKAFCALGSVKSNLGHATTAAGAAGMVRALLALQHETIPPTLHAQPPNPALSLDDSPFFLNADAVAWPRVAGRPRQAAVSSFGFGGTNAHLVLQEAPQPAALPDSGRAWLVPLSARSPQQLRAQAGLLLEHLGQQPALRCADIAFTLCTGRRHLPHRLALVARDAAELRQKLAQWLSEASPEAAAAADESLDARAAALLANAGDPAALPELATLFVAGAQFAPGRLFEGQACRRVPLPSQPFTRKRFWVAQEPQASSVPAASPPPAQVAARSAQPAVRLDAPAAAATKTTAGATGAASAPRIRLAPLVPTVPAAASPAGEVRRLADTEGVCRLQVQGPLDERVLQSLAQELQSAGSDETVRAVLLEAAGPWEGTGPASLARAPLDCAVPVVAATAGARGSGFLLALHCDFALLAAERSYACDPALPLELQHLLRRRFGTPVATRLLEHATGLPGAELDSCGHAVPARDVAARALALARELAAAPRVSLVALKRHMRTGPQVPADLPAAPELPGPVGAAPAHRSRPLPLQSRVIELELFDDGVTVLRMNEREARNTFTPDFMQGMEEAFALIARTPQCSVVVLTGHDHYFACGGTRDGLESLQRGATRFTDRAIYSLPLACELPVLAAMQGHAIGAGWSLGLFCDSAWLAAEAVYHSNYLWYGFTPGAGATLVFPHRLGDDLGREVLFTAREYKGQELAGRTSLVRACPAAEVLPRAVAVAHAMAAQGRDALVAGKRAAAAPLRALLDDVFARELAMHQTTFIGNARVMERIAAVFPDAPSAAPEADAGASLPVERSRVRAWMAHALAEELMIEAQDIADDAGFLQLGLDSILAVTWVRKLNAQFALSLPATSVYAHPTFGALVDHVSRQVKPDPAAQPPGGVAPQPARAGTAGSPQPQPQPIAAAVEPPPPPPSRAAPMAVAVASAHIASVPAQGPDPIAIIGASGRFPRSADLEVFWDNLRDGRDCIGEVLPSRWDIAAHFDADPQAPGKSYSKWMGAIDDIDRFDAAFFNITAREAQLMDPQQRLFLQHAWHAIEDAGLVPGRLAGARCGVFAGSGDSGYARLITERNAYSLIGSAGSILAARIAYLLDLRGPSVALDTACSTSLVAIAQACESLAAGTSDLALAGGACVLLGPQMHVDTCKVSMLSPDGRCYSFDHRANGFVPGEGVGVVLLKRLADALRDGDPVRAVIRGWGTNQDGRTNGITAPNPAAQAELLRDVHRRFGIAPGSIGLIEAHGTGTPLGDPIEIEGLNAAFADVREPASIALGSVKSNVGHLLAAAGVAGAIKAMLALEHRSLPPTVHFERANEHLALAGSPLRVNAALADWPAPPAAPRRAGVSSFGFSGTNAHIVLEEAPARAHAEPARQAPSTLLCVLSARSRAQLTAQAQALARHLARHEDLALEDIAHTLQCGRSAFEFRSAGVFRDRAQLLRHLQAVAAGVADPGVQAWQGSRDGARGALLDDEDGRVLVRKWLAAGRLDKLAEAWTQGVEVDWQALPGSPQRRRIRLPGYAFAGDRHWVEPPAPTPVAAAPAEGATPASTPGRRLHPLIDRNASTLERARFAGRFSGDEAYLSHYVSGAERLLLGLFYPEMARAAGELAAGRPVHALRHMVWGRPAQINGEPRELTVVLSPSDEGLLYRICAEGDETRPCHLGELVLEPEAAWPALPAAQPPADGLDATDAFRAAAPRAAAVRRVVRAGDALFAQVRLERGGLAAMQIDPLMLDLLWELVAFRQRAQGLPGPRFPHALERLLQDGALPDEGWVRLWQPDPASAALSVLLSDASGRPRLLLDGLLTEQVDALPALQLDTERVE